jgi:hypothetical protein
MVMGGRRNETVNLVLIFLTFLLMGVAVLLIAIGIIELWLTSTPIYSSSWSPWPDTEGCWGWFDDTRTCMYFPCEPRPKGSATPLPRTTKEGKPYIQWIAGSNSWRRCQAPRGQERIVSGKAVAAMWKLGFTPYDDAVTLDAVISHSRSLRQLS